MAWRRKLGWVGIVLIAIIVAIGGAGYFILNGPKVHAYLLSEIEKQASQSLGTRVRIQGFSLHLLGLTGNLYGINVAGSDAKFARSLAQADQLTIRIKIVSLLHRKIDLSEIVLRHPVVNLRVRGDGSTNIPTPQSSNNSSRSPFDLGIQRVLIERGEIYYNDVKIPLDAELHQLQMKIAADLVAGGYDGNLSYRDGRIQYGKTKAVPHDAT